MKSRVTKSNYEEVLANIAAEFELEKFTSVSSPIGYPEEEYPLLEGLQSEEQAIEILAKYPKAMFFEVEWRDGWKTKYRRNHLSGPRCYEADDELKYDNDISGLWHKGDNVREFEVFYLGEGLQDECEELINDLDELGLTLDEPMKKYEDCGIDEYNEFYERANKLVIDAQRNEIDIPEYVFEEGEEIHQRVQEVIDMRQELEELEDGEVLVIDNCWRTRVRVIDEKSMYWYDGDVHRCIAVGFDPWFLPSEDEIEDEIEDE